MITKLDLDKLVLTAMAKAHAIEKDYMKNFLGESKFFPYQEIPDAEQNIRIKNTPKRPIEEDNNPA